MLAEISHCTLAATELGELIDEEINDARDYAKDAMHFREKNPGMAQAYSNFHLTSCNTRRSCRGWRCSKKRSTRPPRRRGCSWNGSELVRTSA